MANFQLILSDPKTRRSFKTDVNPPASQVLVGHRIGDIIDGSMISLNVKFKITGGSDKSGVPLRSDLQSSVKRRVVLSEGPGFRPMDRGARKRKLVRGNSISEDVYQVNAVIVEGQLPGQKAEEAEVQQAKPAESEAKAQPSEKPKAETKPKQAKAQRKVTKEEPQKEGAQVAKV